MRFRVVVLFLMLMHNFSFAESTKTGTEKLGDILLVLIPSGAYLTTYINDDQLGREQFYKGFGANLAITYALKSSIDETRPDGSDKQSFPSAHSSITFQSAVFLHKRYGLGYAIPAYIGASYTGWSRVDSKKHYTKDVLAGAALGAASSYYLTTSLGKAVIAPVLSENSASIMLSYKW